MRRVHKYADGGKVVKSETDADHNKQKAKPKPKPKPEMLGSGLAQRAGSALRDRRQQQMDDLGLADGGPVESAGKKAADEAIAASKAAMKPPKLKPHVPPKLESPIKAKAKR